VALKLMGPRSAGFSLADDHFDLHQVGARWASSLTWALGIDK
jgi:hypothetical protein